MLGKVGAPRLKTKGKETHGLVPFCVELLQKYDLKLRAEPPDVRARCSFLLAAGRIWSSYEGHNHLVGWWGVQTMVVDDRSI